MVGVSDAIPAADLTDLPDDPAALKALIIAERKLRSDLNNEVARLSAIVAAFKRALFGRRSEKLDPDQLELALEDAEQELAAQRAESDAGDATLKAARSARRANRGALPAHLPRVEVVVEPESLACACCGGALHPIGEDVSERLDVIPAQFQVLVTRRPKYACRRCAEGVVQAPAPERLVAGGLPTEAMVAHVLVAKYADHLPRYRQAQAYARQGLTLDRSTLADWVGHAARELRPVHARLVELLKTSPKLFMDETKAPVLDPGRGRTKTGWLWAMARDDRPWQGTDPPAVAFLYAEGRGAEHATAHLDGFMGVLQADGYAAYRSLADPQRGDAAVTLAYCWSHCRRKFYDIAEAIRYALKHWHGLLHFLDDGRIELDTNVVERAIRPIVLNRKNALFAGSDVGAEHWAVIASLIETCKLNQVDPHAYLTDVLQRLVAGHLQSRIDDLMPWACANAQV
jgi:transposase